MPLTLFIICNLLFNISYAQNVGINATGLAPAVSAGLDVSFTNKGLLIPQVALTATNLVGPITAPATSLMVYNTATAGVSPNNVIPGYYYWNGTKWIAFGGSGGRDWSLLGNAGTTVTTNFLGTQDSVSVAFKTNNIEHMRLRSDGVMTVNSGGAAFTTSTFHSLATGNNDAIDGEAAGSGAAIYGENSGIGEGVLGLTSNGAGIGTWGYATAAAAEGIRGTNAAATGNAIGFGGFFTSNQTGGAALSSSLGTSSYFDSTAISAITTIGSAAIIADNSNANGVVIQVQTATASVIGVQSLCDNGAVGKSAIYGQQSTPTGNGSGYGITTSHAAIAGQIGGTSTYSFGVLGFSASSGLRTGGVIGLSNTTGSWGALGYNTSIGAIYGLYYTSQTSGTGKYADGGSPSINIGAGGYGDLMGQWTRGNIYGMNIKGNRYGLYVDGKTYTNNVIAQIADNPTSSNRTVAYVSTAVNVDVLDRGMAQLSNGQVYIPFTEAFKNMASTKKPIMVTVTPNGASNGVYVTNVTNKGFMVIENNKGTANTPLTWIAIATRAGYENPKTPVELLSKSYDSNMEKVMANENNKGASTLRMEWNGSALQFSSAQSKGGVKGDAVGLDKKLSKKHLDTTSPLKVKIAKKSGK